MHILDNQYCERLLPRPWRYLKTGAFVALVATQVVGFSAEAQRPCPPDLSGEGTVVQPGAACSLKMDTPDYVDPVANVTLLGGRKVVNATNSAELVTATNNAACGDTIQLSDATYTSNFTIDATCPANNPVIVKGASNFASVINAQASLTGSRNIITGIDFNGGNASVQLYGVNNKLIGNKMRNWTTTRAIMTGGAGQREQEIAYNEITRPTGTTSSPTFAIKADTSSDPNTVPLNVWVHHNFIYGGPDGQGVDTDPMEPGNSSHSWANTLMAGWYIQENLFANYQDCNQNVIDMKFSGTTFLRNTVTGPCSVKFTARIGAFNIFDGNWLEPGQILTHGRGHKVVCNHATIRVQAGQAEWSSTGKQDDKVPHNASYETLVESNDGALLIGYRPNSSYNVAADATVIRNHTGSITTNGSAHLQTNTTTLPTAAAIYVCRSAVKLTASDVGPAALSSASSAYKAARGL